MHFIDYKDQEITSFSKTITTMISTMTITTSKSDL